MSNVRIRHRSHRNKMRPNAISPVYGDRDQYGRQNALRTRQPHRRQPWHDTASRRGQIEQEKSRVAEASRQQHRARLEIDRYKQGTSTIHPGQGTSGTWKKASSEASAVTSRRQHDGNKEQAWPQS